MKSNEPFSMKQIYVGPSDQRNAWNNALFNQDDHVLEQLVAAEPPGTSLFEIKTYINGLYLGCNRFGLPPNSVRSKVERVLLPLKHIRHRLGCRQREADIILMRWIRRASCLSAVIGAGATMDAGGPSWENLVRRLLKIGLEKGYEIREKVVEVKHFDDSQKAIAENILKRIENHDADTETLMEGAQLCSDLCGQHLFTYITGILYETNRKPGSIHRAIAELAHPQVVRDRGPDPLPGWDSIITYNFDDLMGEMLDAEQLPRAAWAMRGDEISGDPNELARKQGRAGLYQDIYHLHGYTPKRPFLITKVQFVFSTMQYRRMYPDAKFEINGTVFEGQMNPDEKSRIIDKVYREFLANPVHYALYIGCSFADETMNNLLRNAADALPGRTHFALLKWPGKKPYEQSSIDEIETESAPFLDFGVQPVWFDDFTEIPHIIRQLK